MNLFKSFFLGIIMVLSLSTVIMLFVLENSQSSLFVENVLSRISLMFRIDSVDLRKKSESKVNNVMEQQYEIKSYFVEYFYICFNNLVIFFRFFDVFFDIFKKKIDDSKKIVMDILMHQSFDVLNSNLIRNTMVVLELESNDDNWYWIIQLGALRNSQRVSEIVNKLKNYNYPVYIVSDIDDKGLIRIFVGPYTSKMHLESLLDDLYHLSTLRGKISFYRKF